MEEKIIKLSRSTGKPPVNSFALDQLAWNVRTGLLWAKTQDENGSEHVVCIGQATVPGSGHARMHSMTDPLDHAPVDPDFYGMIPRANPTTGAWELVPMVTGTGSESIHIPELKYEFSTYPIDGTAQNDIIKCWWESKNIQFLDYNPEIWSFQYKKLRRKRNVTSNHFGKEFFPDSTLHDKTQWPTNYAEYDPDLFRMNINGTSSDYAFESLESLDLRTYQIQFTVSNYEFGSIRTCVGGDSWGEYRSSNGTFTEIVQCVSAESLKFYCDDVNSHLSVTFISAKPVSVSSLETVKSSRRWRHQSHLNGINHLGLNQYTGAMTSECDALSLTGRKTEFPLTSILNKTKQILPIDPWDYYLNGTAQPPILITSLADLDVPGFCISLPGNKYYSAQFRFCITIDNPDYDPQNGSQPKLFGPLGDIITMRYTKLFDSNYRIKFSRENQGLKLI